MKFGIAVFSLAILFDGAVGRCCAQSSIVLRDLTLLTDVRVESFSQESIRLSDGSELGWEEVLRAKVEVKRQAEFDRNVEEIGLPVFRLKQRIAIKDWARVNEASDVLLIRYSGIDSRTAKLVCLAAAKGKLESGQRAEAVLPFLMACQKSSELSPDELDALSFTSSELSSGMAFKLLPVWFDLELVRSQKAAIESFARENAGQLSIGAKIYLASFELSLEEFDRAKEILEAFQTTDLVQKQWKSLLSSEIDRRTRVDANRLNLFRVDGDTRPGPEAASLYFDAVAFDARKDDAEPIPQILRYLKVPALWGSEFPNLSSAAIYRAIELARGAKMEEEVKTLTSELLRGYSKSYHGKLVGSQEPRRR